jgi:hypothetical protein
MSKGLGSLQRKLIDISTATKTIWEVMPDGIKVEVADTEEKTACGITTQAQEGSTWRQTGEPWHRAETTVKSRDHLTELAAAFRHVQVINRSPDDSALTACWSMHHIRATLWPDLWKHGDNRVELQHPTCRHSTFPQIPPDIKKGRNTAQAGLSRAMASLVKRGMVIYAGCTHTAAANSIWKSHGGGLCYVSRFHVVFYVLHPDLVRRS